MKQKRVFLTVGIPGSGKSTWVQKRIQQEGGLYISRDLIRFSLLKDEDDYFEKEHLVFKQFIDLIQAGLDTNEIEDIYIDATHLNEKSRRKVLDQLDLRNVKDIIILYFKVCAETALKRNMQRTGREFVPESVILDMSNKFFKPQSTEKYKYIIWTINEYGEVINVE